MNWHSWTRIRRGAAVVAGALAIGAGVAGCAAGVSSYPAEATLTGGVIVTSPPPYVTSYPSVIYDGRPAYLVGSSWYYDSPRGWVVLQSEPPPLYRYRVQYYGGYGHRGYSPEPYTRHRGYVQQAPPAYHYPSAPRAAPPARRVR